MPISGECEAWIHKQSQGFFLKGNWVREKKNVWPWAYRDGQDSVGCVWSGAKLSPGSMQRQIKVVESDGR